MIILWVNVALIGFLGAIWSGNGNFNWIVKLSLIVLAVVNLYFAIKTTN